MSMSAFGVEDNRLSKADRSYAGASVMGRPRAAERARASANVAGQRVAASTAGGKARSAGQAGRSAATSAGRQAADAGRRGAANVAGRAHAAGSLASARAGRAAESGSGTGMKVLRAIGASRAAQHPGLVGGVGAGIGAAGALAVRNHRRNQD